MTFTADNTEGFTAADLTEMNKAAAFLMNNGFDEKSAADAVNNAWQEDLSANEIVQRIEMFGMITV